MELTPEEIEEFRAAYRRRWSKDCTRYGPVIRLLGGPLDGLGIKVTSLMVRAEFIAFCHLYDRCGHVQAIYRRETPRTYAFHELSSSSQQSPGYPLDPFRKK